MQCRDSRELAESSGGDGPSWSRAQVCWESSASWDCKAVCHERTRTRREFRKLENVLLGIDFVIFFVMVTKLVATRRSRFFKNVNTRGKNLNGTTLVVKITNGTIILGKIENGDK